MLKKKINVMLRYLIKNNQENKNDVLHRKLRKIFYNSNKKIEKYKLGEHKIRKYFCIRLLAIN